MSSSPVIPREKLSAYQRWELHSFDEPRPARTAEPLRAAAPDPAKQMHELAYQAGLTEGARRGAQQAAGDLERLQALVTAISARSAENGQAVANEILALALEIARQMTRKALQVRPELVLPVIQEALARVLPPAQQASLTVHPDDARLAREHLAEQLAAGGWRIIEDAAVERGGCVLATASSQIDASTPTRWRQLTGALGENSEWLE